jgi:hypothetical protein
VSDNLRNGTLGYFSVTRVIIRDIYVIRRYWVSDTKGIVNIRGIANIKGIR